MNARAARAGASVLHPPRPVPPRSSRARTAKAPLAVVPTPAPRTGRASFVMLIVLLLSGGLAALLGFNTALAQGSFTASKLQKQATDLDDRAQTLEEQLAKADSPDRLEKAARKIGMVPAPSVAFVQLSDGSVTGSTAPAPAAPKPLTPQEKAELAAKQQAQAQADAEKAAAAKAAKALKAQQAAEEQQRIAAEQAAAAAAAAQAQAQAEWQKKLQEQEKGGSRSGGEQVVDPPPGR